MRSVFLGFETLSPGNLAGHGKRQNVARVYDEAVRRAHGIGMMVNGSFVFGLEHDDPDVFDRTVEWAVSAGIETATFHILTPYPGTGLHTRLRNEGRILHDDWDRYTTREVVYRPRNLTVEQLTNGYHRAYRDFYRWGAILQSARVHGTQRDRLRHLAYAGGWKKFEWLWDQVVSARQINRALPMLEAVLSGFGAHPARNRDTTDVVAESPTLQDLAVEAA